MAAVLVFVSPKSSLSTCPPPWWDHLFFLFFAGYFLPVPGFFFFFTIISPLSRPSLFFFFPSRCVLRFRTSLPPSRVFFQYCDGFSPFPPPNKFPPFRTTSAWCMFFRVVEASFSLFWAGGYFLFLIWKSSFHASI